MRISDWSSDVCSSDLSYLASSSAFDPRRRERSPLIPQKSISRFHDGPQPSGALNMIRLETGNGGMVEPLARRAETKIRRGDRSEEHTSELQSLMRSSYAVFCLQIKNQSNKA